MECGNNAFADKFVGRRFRNDIRRDTQPGIFQQQPQERTRLGPHLLVRTAGNSAEHRRMGLRAGRLRTAAVNGVHDRQRRYELEIRTARRRKFRTGGKARSKIRAAGNLRRLPQLQAGNNRRLVGSFHMRHALLPVAVDRIACSCKKRVLRIQQRHTDRRLTPVARQTRAAARRQRQHNYRTQFALRLPRQRALQPQALAAPRRIGSELSDRQRHKPRPAHSRRLRQAAPEGCDETAGIILQIPARR